MNDQRPTKRPWDPWDPWAGIRVQSKSQDFPRHTQQTKTFVDGCKLQKQTTNNMILWAWTY